MEFDQSIKIKLNTEIKQTNNARYLGILIDKMFTWTEDIQCLNLKISKGNGILYRIRDFVSHTTLRRLYCAFT